MNPGKLNTPIIFEKPATDTTAGTRGHVVKDWLFYSQSFGAIDYGMEADVPDQFRRVGEQAISVTIRYNAAITSALRMKINNEYYYISGVAPDKRRMYLTIDAATKR